MSIPHALGWTSIHFLWQGLAIALACWAMLVLARSSRLRYAIGYAGLLAMLAAPIATFLLLDEPASTSASHVMLTDDGAAGVTIARPDRDMLITNDDKPPAGYRTLISMMIPWLGRSWVVGVALIAAWHGLGMFQLQGIRRKSAAFREGDWTARVRRLADRLAIHRNIEVLVCRAIDCPAVVGCLKPAILWPAAALSGLTPTQIDALLAHELAHIRRQDHWLNLIQVCIETVLFFHPCVWWLSRRVRQERENCCDDLAASVLGDRVEYAGALLAMESLRQARFLSLQANGGSLMNRIQRLLNIAAPGPRSARSAQGAIAVVALCASASLLVGQAPAELEPSTQPSVAIEAPAGPTLSSLLDEYVQSKQHGTELGKTHSSFSPEFAAHAQRELEIKQKWTQRAFELAGREDASAQLDAELKPIAESKSGKHLSSMLGLATREAELQLGKDSTVAKRLEEKLETIVERQAEQTLAKLDTRFFGERGLVKERQLQPRQRVRVTERFPKALGESPTTAPAEAADEVIEGDVRVQFDDMTQGLAEIEADIANELEPEMVKLRDYLAQFGDAKAQAEMAAELANVYRHHADAKKEIEAAHAEAAAAHKQAIEAQARAYAERDAALARRKNADEQRIYAQAMREAAAEQRKAASEQRRAAESQRKAELERAAAGRAAQSPMQVVTPQAMLDSLAQQRDHLSALIGEKQADANTPKEALDELRKSLAEIEARIQQLIATSRPAI